MAYCGFVYIRVAEENKKLNYTPNLFYKHPIIV